MLALGDEVSLCHFRINAALQIVHGASAPAASQRAVLRNLSQHGPMTVPQIAALRPVTRQYMQAVVNDLRRDGLVELIANPAHKRSKLVQLNTRGRVALRAMLEHQRPILTSAKRRVGLTLVQINETRLALERFRRHMDDLVDSRNRSDEA